MKLIADNLRITKPNIQNALKARDPKAFQDLVKQCVARGTWTIDVNNLKIIILNPDTLYR